MGPKYPIEFQDRRIRPLCHPSVIRFCQYLQLFSKSRFERGLSLDQVTRHFLHERTSLKKRSWDLRRFSNFRQSQDEAIWLSAFLRAGLVLMIDGAMRYCFPR